jgi:tetratricopeptide (TPR) repeat protein
MRAVPYVEIVAFSILPATWCYETIFAWAVGVVNRGEVQGMFKARLKPSEQGTLERRYEFHLGEAARAALLGDHEKAAGHSRTALAISRELYAGARDPQGQRPGLAAALASNARYQRALEAVEMLTESAGHYARLADADPASFEMERIDVLVRVALAADTAGSTRDAIRLLREVVTMYQQAPSLEPAARDAGLARANFHLGRCLLAVGKTAEGLECIDAGLAAAEAIRRELTTACGRAADDICGRGAGHVTGWLSGAPRSIQLLVPDWLAAASRAMALHAAAGRWPAAATAACAAVRVSGGLAELGGGACLEAHASILARARDIWARARASGIRATHYAHEPAATATGR